MAQKNKKSAPIVGIIDYGMGNLRSVGKAVEHLGGNVYVGSDRKKLSQADKLILPGVGAFGDAMRELRKKGLILVIKGAVIQNKPLLGICLGLQLLFEGSEETPNIRGLGIWKGKVAKFRLPKQSNWKIPHMGWNQVRIRKRVPVIDKVKDNEYFYFVHSYYAKPEDRSLIVGTTHYGVAFPSILANTHVFAAQFHPEKSQSTGLAILKNFIEL